MEPEYKINGTIKMPLSDFIEFAMRYYPAKYAPGEDAVHFGVPEIDRAADMITIRFSAANGADKDIEPDDIAAEWADYSNWITTV